MIRLDGMKCLSSGELEGLRRGSASSSHSDPVIEIGGTLQLRSNLPTSNPDGGLIKLELEL